jgi:hypothetical protein
MPISSSKKLKYKKAPEAPIRFKSAYIFFSIAKQKEIRASMTEKVSFRMTKK